jgi:hypothetical protein
MKTQHLSDENIQEYILSKSHEMSVIEHLHGCDVCKAKVEVYQNIITGIKELAPAEFDFNLSELVMVKIEQKDFNYSNVFWLLVILGIGVMVITVLFFGRHMANLFSGVSEMASYLVVTTAVVLLLFQGVEIVRKYKRQIDSVNLG